MRQTISRPPSKPVHPRECRCRRPGQYRCAIVRQGKPLDRGGQRPVHCRCQRLCLAPMRVPHRADRGPALPRGAAAAIVLAVLVLLASLLVVRAVLARRAASARWTRRQADFVAATERNRRAAAASGWAYYELMTRGGVSLFASVARPTPAAVAGLRRRPGPAGAVPGDGRAGLRGLRCRPGSCPTCSESMRAERPGSVRSPPARRRASTTGAILYPGTEGRRRTSTRSATTCIPSRCATRRWKPRCDSGQPR